MSLTQSNRQKLSDMAVQMREMTAEMNAFSGRKSEVGMNVVDSNAAARSAVLHILKRLRSDPRLAYLMGPGSEAFELLMVAGAAIGGYDVAPYKHDFPIGLNTQKVPGIGKAFPVLDDELLARIAVYDDKVHNLYDQDDLSMLVNHFVRRGLDVAEAERDTQTEGLF